MLRMSSSTTSTLRPVQGLIALVQVLDHVLLRLGQVRDDPVQEQRGLIEQPLRRAHALEHDALGLLAQLALLGLRKLAAREHDDRGLPQLRILLNLGQQVEARHVRQPQIQHHAVEGGCSRISSRAAAPVPAGVISTSLCAEQLRDAHLLGRIILHHEQLRACAAS